MAKFKVEGLGSEGWSEEYTGGNRANNRWNSRQEAEAHADELAELDWGAGEKAPREEFRVVEVSDGE